MIVCFVLLAVIMMMLAAWGQKMIEGVEIQRSINTYQANTIAFERENERIALRFGRCRTLVDLENELVDYLQEVAAQRMSTYKILAASFGQQGPLPDCTDDCRRQLNAITDELLDRLRAAGEIDPALTTAACHTALFCTVTGGLVALCCSAVSGDTLPDLPQNLRDNLHRSLRAGKPKAALV